MQKSRWNSLAQPNLIVLIVFAVFAALAGLTTLPPLDRDEARFAQATAQMLETGDYVTIRLQEKERNKKPVGIHWMQAASVSVFSDVEDRSIWAYRLPSLIGALLAVIFTYFAALRLYDQHTAFLAGMLMASAPVLIVEATIAKTDAFLLAMICVAQYAFIEIYARMREGAATSTRWPILFWAAQGAGILIKGPIAPLVSALTALALAVKTPKLNWRTALRPFMGAAILIIMVAPWAIAIAVATQGRFFSEAVSVDMLGKIGVAQEGHVGPPGYHTVLVWALFWPAAALIGPGLAQAWRERAKWQARFVLAWIVPTWIVFELTATKLPHYVLPLYPAIAIAAARAAYAPDRDRPLLRKAGAVAYGAIGLVVAALIVAPLLFLGEEPVPPTLFAAGAVIAVAAVIIAAAFWKGSAYGGALAAAGLSAIFAWTMMTAVMPRLSALALSPRISEALEDAGRHPRLDNVAPVALAGYHEPSAVFLLGTASRLVNGEAAAHELAAGSVSAAIIESRHQDAFITTSAALDLQTTTLAVIEGLNYSNGDDARLTIFIRAEED